MPFNSCIVAVAFGFIFGDFIIAGYLSGAIILGIIVGDALIRAVDFGFVAGKRRV